MTETNDFAAALASFNQWCNWYSKERLTDGAVIKEAELFQDRHRIRRALEMASDPAFVRVPVIATENMLYMGFRHQYGDSSTTVKPVFVIRDIYNAMIAASQTPPTAEDSHD